MLKRKQAELKSSSIQLSLHKWNLQNVKSSALSHLNIDAVQPFYPSLEMLFKTDYQKNYKILFIHMTPFFMMNMITIIYLNYNPYNIYLLMNTV